MSRLKRLRKDARMLFNSYFFLFLFLPLVLLCYYGLNHINRPKAALFSLIIMSFFFCGYNNICYLLVLFLSILLNYACITGIRRFRGRGRTLCLLADIFLNIGVLFYFKYWNFFTQNINNMFGTKIPLLNLLLPLGISFYTFQQISFVIDAYRGECENYGFLQYVLFISFFPKLTQGPIVYHKDLLPQFRTDGNCKIDFENLCRGIYAFSLGLAKKVLIADNFAKIVNAGYGNLSQLNSPGAFLVMVGYSLQIYFDFSGYCDMAYGICYLLGIRLSLNFNSPYKAQSVSDFWDRWHITLTKFFTRYVYIPLGGSRRGTVRTCVNILIVFLLSGLWHGANWTFVLWGLMHGIIKVFERVTNISALKIPKFLKIAVTFFLVTFAWSLFRAQSLPDALLLWTQLLSGGFDGICRPVTEAFCEIVEVRFLYRVFRTAGLSGVLERFTWLPVSAFTCICLIACFTMKHTQEKTERLRLTRAKLFTVVILMFWSILSLSEISEFLYSNF